MTSGPKADSPTASTPAGIIDTAMGRDGQARLQAASRPRPSDWDEIAQLADQIAELITEIAALRRGSRAQLLDGLIRETVLRSLPARLDEFLADPKTKAALKKDLNRKPRSNERTMSAKLRVRIAYQALCDAAGKTVDKNKVAEQIAGSLAKKGKAIGTDTVRRYLQGFKSGGG